MSSSGHQGINKVVYYSVKYIFKFVIKRFTHTMCIKELKRTYVTQIISNELGVPQGCILRPSKLCELYKCCIISLDTNIFY